MQKIKLRNQEIVGNDAYIIVGEPSEELLETQLKGEIVLCELRSLQGLDEDEIEKRIKDDTSLWQYENICVNFDELPDAFLERMWFRYKGEAVIIAKTERLLIRESVPKDAVAFMELYADKEVRRFVELPYIEETYKEVSEEKVKAYESYIAQYAKEQYGYFEYGMWSVVEKESGKVIGRMGLENQKISTGEEKIALGYALLPEYRGKGYAYEACMAILDYYIKSGYEKEIYVKIDNENLKSDNLYKKLNENSKEILRKM